MDLQIAITTTGRTLAVEVHPDGTVSTWSFSVYGPVGQTGQPHPGVVVRPAKNKKERQLIESARSMIERAQRSQNAIVSLSQAHR